VIRIERDDPRRKDVQRLLSEHLADMFATSPAESVHALDPAALSGPTITFWTAQEDSELLGCGALKQLLPGHGEIKSMRTTVHSRGRGIGALLLTHILEAARRSQFQRLYLETGTQEFFAPARRLYHRHGFAECPPFAGYGLDPHSLYMMLQLQLKDLASSS
jgi:putative acetyltransferase